MLSRNGWKFTRKIDGKMLGLILLAAALLAAGVYLLARQREPANLNGPGKASRGGAWAVFAQEGPGPNRVPDAPQARDPGLAYTTNGEWVPAESVARVIPGEAEENPASAAPASTGQRHVYLTKENYPTDAVLAACGTGYHMASLWEIYDVTNLVYDASHPAAFSKADDGSGPPAHWHGWVRTGGDASNSQTAGQGNCSGWTSRSDAVYGVSVRLSNDWEAAPGDMGPWDANSFACNFAGPVWCVKD